MQSNDSYDRSDDVEQDYVAAIEECAQLIAEYIGGSLLKLDEETKYPPSIHARHCRVPVSQLRGRPEITRQRRGYMSMR